MGWPWGNPLSSNRLRFRVRTRGHACARRDDSKEALTPTPPPRLVRFPSTSGVSVHERPHDERARTDEEPHQVAARRRRSCDTASGRRLRRRKRPAGHRHNPPLRGCMLAESEVRAGAHPHPLDASHCRRRYGCRRPWRRVARVVSTKAAPAQHHATIRFPRNRVPRADAAAHTRRGEKGTVMPPAPPNEHSRLSNSKPSPPGNGNDRPRAGPQSAPQGAAIRKWPCRRIR